MFDLITTLLLVTALLNFGLVAFVCSRNPRSRTNLSFAGFALCLALWALFIVGFRLAPAEVLAVYFLRLSYVSALLIGACFYYFSIAFPDGSSPSRWHTIALAIGTAGLCAALLLPTFITGAVIDEAWSVRTVQLLEPGYWIFATAFCLLFLGGQVRLWRKYAGATGLLRIQLLSIGLSVTIIGALGIYYNLVLPSPFFEDFRYVWTGPLLTSVFAVVIIYSIFRFRLFDAKALFAELLVFTLWLILTVRIATAATRLEQLQDLIVLAFAIGIGILLLRSVRLEVRSREQLASANEQLKEIDRMKSELLSIATHQLRGPVTVIRSAAAEIIAGSYGIVPKEAATIVGQIAESSRGLALVIEDYLNVSRIEQGRMNYAFERVDLRQLLERVVQELTPIAQRKSLKLSLAVEDGTYLATVDQGKLSQALFNLLDNSIKYTPSGEVAVRLSARPERVSFLIAISDTGVGIDANTMPKLFQRFSRAAGSSRINSGGSGLGLYVVRQLVEAHHGRVWAESPGAGKGATFFVELPANQGAAVTAPESAPAIGQ